MTSSVFSPLELTWFQRPYNPKPAVHPKTLQSATITLNPANRAHPGEQPISDKLYAGFLEHLGRCIYGGIVDAPKKPSPEKLLMKQDEGDERTKGRLGWRKDVFDVIKRDGELEIPMLRWPGGNFVSSYNWKDGIGSVTQRPKRLELAWLADESNVFGTDEYMDYCRATKCEPYICLNMGTGSLEDALHWVEYCNSKADTYYANLRRKNTGRDEPHNVKYWGLGNEIYGPWQLGQISAKEYAHKAKTWAHALKQVDPTIKLVSCGNTGCTDWDREVLATMVGFADLHSIHHYSMNGHHKGPAGNEYEKNVFGPAYAENAVKICKSLIDLANIERSFMGIPARDVKIAFDEWNVWDESVAPGSGGVEQWYTFTDMLAFCAWLNLLVRQSKDIGLACLAQSVNVIAPIMTKPDGMVRQSIFYPLQLFSKYMKNGYLLQIANTADVYDGPSHPPAIEQTGMKPSYIDMVAVAVETDGGESIRLSILNRHPNADWEGTFKFDGYNVASVEIHEISSDDLQAVNTFEEPEKIKPSIKDISKEAKEAKEGLELTVKKHSWVFLILNGHR